ncbi:MAG: porin [Pseudomonadota bacterium]
MGHETVSSPARTKSPLAVVAAAVAVGALSSPVFAGIELGEGLSVTGFVDMSIFHYDPDGASSSTSSSVDQVETDFMYSGSDGVSAEVDLEYNDFDGTFVEQAFITKQFTDQFSVKAGRFLSYSGWETEEPTGLFQYSGAGYAPYFYGYYQQGVSAAYKTDKFGFTASVVNSAFDPLARDSGKPGYELGASVTPVEGLTAKLFYIVNKYDGASDDDEIINFWTSYAIGGFTFAGEYNTADYAGGGSGDGFLLMANYATGPWGFTVRYVDFEIEDAGGFTTVEDSSITLSPSYKVGKNLLVVAEFRTDDFGAGGDANSIALEALFTF